MRGLTLGGDEIALYPLFLVPFSRVRVAQYPYGSFYHWRQRRVVDDFCECLGRGEGRIEFCEGERNGFDLWSFRGFCAMLNPTGIASTISA